MLAQVCVCMNIYIYIYIYICMYVYITVCVLSLHSMLPQLHKGVAKNLQHHLGGESIYRNRECDNTYIIPDGVIIPISYYVYIYIHTYDYICMKL